MVLSVFSVTGFVNFSDFSMIRISFPICARANATFFSIKESVLTDCLFFSVQDTHKVGTVVKRIKLYNELIANAI